MRSKLFTSHHIWLFLCTALTLTILWLGLMPATSAPAGAGWDKLNHIGAIGVATGLAFLAFKPGRRAAAAAVVYGISLGILIEILQATVTTTRAAEWGDIIADAIGAGFMWIVIRFFQCRSAPKQ